MPVPVWDCTDMSAMDEPLDTVLSDDIWKKFDLDEPLDAPYIHGHHAGNNSHVGGMMSDKTITAMTMMMSSVSNNSYEESDAAGQTVTLPEFYDKLGFPEAREIRHHDCMWAGLCISKEHNRTLPAKKDSLVQSKKVPAGRSLLISRATNVSNPQHQQHQQHSLQHQQQMQTQSLYQQRRKDSLESDGNSTRPETPQSTESETDSDEDEEDEDDDEDEEMENDSDVIQNSRVVARRQIPNETIRIKHEDVTPIFKHDQISINDKLSECMSDDITNIKAAPVSAVTGQLVTRWVNANSSRNKTKKEDSRGCEERSNNEERQSAVKIESDNWSTLSDHCYHQPSSKKFEHLGVQTPSDSEEEIDVVTFEKPSRPAALPTYPSIADQQHFQLTVNSALKEKPATAPRPRGRPPANGGGNSGGGTRKRSSTGSNEPDQTPAKRTRQRTYQRRAKVTKNGPPTPAASPIKAPLTPTPGTSTSRSTSSDDEPDSEKRSLHNNMERQRRIELRNAFEDLRLLVPAIEDKERAAKVTILRQSAAYCDMLTEINEATTAKVAEMKKQQERLRAKLSQLRRNLAMTR